MAESSNAPATAAPELQFESFDADHALFEGRVQGLIAVITPHERPLQGLAGLLDWRFQGVISDFLESGAVSGHTGECTYVPVRRAGTTYHLFLVGADHRGAVPAESVKTLKKNLASLGLERIGVSRGDWNAATDEYFQRNLKGTGVWVLR